MILPGRGTGASSRTDLQGQPRSRLAPHAADLALDLAPAGDQLDHVEAKRGAAQERDTTLVALHHADFRRPLRR